MGRNIKLDFILIIIAKGPCSFAFSIVILCLHLPVLLVWFLLVGKCDRGAVV